MSIFIKGIEMPPVGTGKVIMIDSDGDVWTSGRDDLTIIDGAKAVPVQAHDNLVTALRFCVDKNRKCSECPYYERCMNDTTGKHVAMVDAANAIEELTAIVEGYKRIVEKDKA